MRHGRLRAGFIVISSVTTWPSLATFRRKSPSLCHHSDHSCFVDDFGGRVHDNLGLVKELVMDFKPSSCVFEDQFVVMMIIASVDLGARAGEVKIVVPYEYFRVGLFDDV